MTSNTNNNLTTSLMVGLEHPAMEVTTFYMPLAKIYKHIEILFQVKLTNGTKDIDIQDYSNSTFDLNDYSNLTNEFDKVKTRVDQFNWECCDSTVDIAGFNFLSRNI